MTFLSGIEAWLKNNDLIIEVIAFLAAPGGIWFWVDKFKNRICIRIRKLGLPLCDQTNRGITFEAENISSTLTSFEPKFTLTGYLPERSKQISKQTYTFTFQDTDRQLPSHVSKAFLGWHNETEKQMLFLWFMTFRFPLSRGGCVRVRVRNAHFETLGFFRFHWERLRFLWFGKLPG